MNQLHCAENLARLRKERKITQEELADFIGVTKASVSKWENGQSMPDILLLPQLASFFDVTVDALLGYEPQMSREQIRVCYQKLAREFAEGEFEEVMEKSEKLVKKYYSCYPFLTQMGVLWMNHFMMAKEKTRQEEILEKLEELCKHILKHCKDLALQNQAMEMKAFSDLQRGKSQEVIDALETVCTANRYEQKNSLLIKAYMIKGDKEMASQALQVELYRNVMQALGNQIFLMAVYQEDETRYQEIIRRSDALVEAFDLMNLNPNLAANYEIQTALVLMDRGKEEESMERLRRYGQAVETLFRKQITLQGDAYFDQLEYWFEELELGGDLVRDPKLVAESAMSVFAYPSFQKMKDQKTFQKIKASMEEVIRNLTGEENK